MQWFMNCLWIKLTLWLLTLSRSSFGFHCKYITELFRDAYTTPVKSFSEPHGGLSLTQYWRWYEKCMYQYCVHVEVTGFRKDISSSRADICFIFYMQDIICCYSVMYTKTCWAFVGNTWSKVSTRTQGGAAGLTQQIYYFTAQTILCEKISPMKTFLFWFSTF